MANSAYTRYIENHKAKKTKLKVFLQGGAMLTGTINDFDEDFVVLDSCLISIDKIISIAIFS